MRMEDLRGRRATVAKDIKTLLDSRDAKSWTPADTETYDAAMAEVDAIDASIARIQAAAERLADDARSDHVREAAARAQRGAPDERKPLFDKYLRGGIEALAPAEFGQVFNTLSVGTGSQGGYTVQTSVATIIMDALKAYGGMRSVATVIRTDQGNQINYPTSDGTTETGELIAENTTATSADPTFGQVALPVYKFSSKIVAAPFELLQDSNVDMESFIVGRLGTRVGRAQNTYFTTGTGTAQPNGVVTAAASGKVGTTGQTTTVIVDDLIDLIHAVDPAYRNRGLCRFMMADSSLKVIRKIKDTAGRPVFQPSYDESIVAGVPDLLLGYPITINQDVATMAANAKSILFGDFSYYVIRDAMDVTMFRFTDSAYAKLGQVGFMAWARAGGNFTDVGGAVKYYQNSAT